MVVLKKELVENKVAMIVIKQEVIYRPKKEV